MFKHLNPVRLDLKLSLQKKIFKSEVIWSSLIGPKVLTPKCAIIREFIFLFFNGSEMICRDASQFIWRCLPFWLGHHHRWRHHAFWENSLIQNLFFFIFNAFVVAFFNTLKLKWTHLSLQLWCHYYHDTIYTFSMVTLTLAAPFGVWYMLSQIM